MKKKLRLVPLKALVLIIAILGLLITGFDNLQSNLSNGLLNLSTTWLYYFVLIALIYRSVKRQRFQYELPLVVVCTVLLFVLFSFPLAGMFKWANAPHTMILIGWGIISGLLLTELGGLIKFNINNDIEE